MKQLLKSILLFLLTLISAHAFAQLKDQTKIDSLLKELPKQKEDTFKVRIMIKIATKLRGTDVDKALSIDKDALALSNKINYNFGVAQAMNGIGLGNYFLGNYSEAIKYWQDAKVFYEKIGDLKGVANMLSNMGAIYFNQSNYPKAIELDLEALKMAEKEKDTLRIATVWQNIGAVHIEKKDFALAIDAFQKALPYFKAINNKEGIGVSYLNLGECYTGKKEYASATKNIEQALQYLPSTNYYVGALRVMGDIQLELSNTKDALVYLNLAYNEAHKSGDEFELARIVNTIARVYKSKSDWLKALHYYEKGKTLSLSSKSDAELIVSTESLVEIYSLKKEYKRAFENQQILLQAKDSVYNQESDQKMNQLLFNFDLEKKNNEISLLVKDKKIQTIEVDKQKQLRNIFIGGFVIVLLFAGAFFSQRNKIKAGKKQSDDLLLNILPAEVAEELKNKGTADAKHFENVTVFFTDFVNFTKVSESLSPQELVNELHACFKAFDDIIGNHGIEKIKTIGDAYLAVCGLPHADEQHPQKVVRAALEICAFMKIRHQQLGNKTFEIRIGINTGSVVAGIVGVKKFAYDIWGDTVNTAARMEQNSEAGKVNISGTTYAFVKDNFTCLHRGKVSAKGKGEIDMYFVETVS